MEVGPRGEDCALRPYRLRAARAPDVDPAHASAGGVDPLHAPFEQPDSALSRALEQVHAELLAAEPAASAGVQQGDRIVGEPRIVTANERGLGDQIGAPERPVEAVGRRRPVVARPRRVPAHGARAEVCRLVRRLGEEVGARGIRRREEIAAPVEAKDVAALAGELLEEIDAAVHDRDHVVARAGPPVAVALGGLVARERTPAMPAPQITTSPVVRSMSGRKHTAGRASTLRERL